MQTKDWKEVQKKGEEGRGMEESKDWLQPIPKFDAGESQKQHASVSEGLLGSTPLAVKGDQPVPGIAPDAPHTQGAGSTNGLCQGQQCAGVSFKHGHSSLGSMLRLSKFRIPGIYCICYMLWKGWKELVKAKRRSLFLSRLKMVLAARCLEHVKLSCVDDMKDPSCDNKTDLSTSSTTRQREPNHFVRLPLKVQCKVRCAPRRGNFPETCVLWCSADTGVRPTWHPAHEALEAARQKEKEAQETQVE
eukprot:scaffold77539_cov16-Tisochrysis_lutea.AAC.4